MSMQHALDDLKKEVIQGRGMEKDYLKVKAKVGHRSRTR